MESELLFGSVPSHWEVTTLGEVCKRGGGQIQTGPFGSQLHAADYVEHGIPSIMPVNIGDNRIIPDGIAKVTEKDAERLAQHRVQVGDIVYSRRGDVERRALIRKSEEGWLCGTGCLKVRLGKGVVDPRFASFQLGLPVTREWIVRHAIGATMPNLNTAIMNSVPFVLPPIKEQIEIAQILENFEDKIELNRRMNGTLEAMARSLFQSWFVDFDPVRAKIDGRKPAWMDDETAALFPSEFQDSSMGLIPKGWTVSTIGEISSRIAMGPFGSRITRDNFVLNGVPVIRGGNLTDGFIDKDFVYLSESKAEELKNSIASALDIVITHRGTLGQVGIIPSVSKFPRYVVSQSQMFVSAHKQKISPWIVYLFLKAKIGNEALLANTSTTGVPAISRPTTSLKAIPLVVPEFIISKKFDLFIEDIFRQIYKNTQHSETLSELRDLLLPKLLSGEISVSSEEVKEAVNA